MVEIKTNASIRMSARLQHWMALVHTVAQATMTIATCSMINLETRIWKIAENP